MNTLKFITSIFIVSLFCVHAETSLKREDADGCTEPNFGVYCVEYPPTNSYEDEDGKFKCYDNAVETATTKEQSGVQTVTYSCECIEGYTPFYSYCVNQQPTNSYKNDEGQYKCHENAREIETDLTGNSGLVSKEYSCECFDGTKPFGAYCTNEKPLNSFVEDNEYKCYENAIPSYNENEDSPYSCDCKASFYSFGSFCVSTKPTDSVKSGNEYICNDGLIPKQVIINDETSYTCNCPDDMFAFSSFCVLSKPTNSYLDESEYKCNQNAESVRRKEGENYLFSCNCVDSYIPFYEYCSYSLPMYAIEERDDETGETIAYVCPSDTVLKPISTHQGDLYCGCGENEEVYIQNIGCGKIDRTLFKCDTSSSGDIIGCTCSSNNVVSVKKNMKNEIIFSCSCDAFNGYFLDTSNGYCSVCPEKTVYNGEKCVCINGYKQIGEVCYEDCHPFVKKDSGECECPDYSVFDYVQKECVCDDQYQREETGNGKFICKRKCEEPLIFDMISNKCVCPEPNVVFVDMCLPQLPPLVVYNETIEGYQCKNHSVSKKIVVDDGEENVTRKREGTTLIEENTDTETTNELTQLGCVCEVNYTYVKKTDECIYTCNATKHLLPNDDNDGCVCEFGFIPNEDEEDEDVPCVPVCLEDQHEIREGSTIQCICKDQNKYLFEGQCISSLPKLVTFENNEYKCKDHSVKKSSGEIDMDGCECVSDDQKQYLYDEVTDSCILICDATKKQQRNKLNDACECIEGYIDVTSKYKDMNEPLICQIECGDNQETIYPSKKRIIKKEETIETSDQNEEEKVASGDNKVDNSQEQNENENVTTGNPWDMVCSCKTNYVNKNTSGKELNCVFNCDNSKDEFTNPTNDGCMCGDKTIKENKTDEDGNIIGFHCVSGSSLISVCWLVFVTFMIFV